MIYVTLQDAIAIHSYIVLEIGGLDGIRDISLLESALEAPKATMFGEDLYPAIFDKAAAYLYHIARNHAFLDGNKRSATAIALSFLEFNGKAIYLTEEKSIDLEELTVEVAEGHVSKGDISLFLQSCYVGDI